MTLIFLYFQIQLILFISCILLLLSILGPKKGLSILGSHVERNAVKERLKAADGFLIASPEYNSSYPALVKNVIDWATRPAAGEAMLAAFSGKACGLLAASPGALGGIRMLPQLRLLLSNISVLVVPAQFGLGRAHEAFEEDGSLKDERSRAMLQQVVTQTVELAGR